MTHDSYKTWIDAMPIEDVRRRIERLERKIADMRMLERLYEERHGGDNGVENGGEDAAQQPHAEPWSEGAPE